ncbi:MAG TPA: PhzF family phenazine biosynthesis protein, partial [Solirubrobacteraceae bacterium]|nr:PhzF family phenazine biosynthesis protein [Solirubrobacteraceae bacterium]
MSDGAGAGAGAPSDPAAAVDLVRGFDPLGAPETVVPEREPVRRLPYVLLDVFSAVPLAGNQLAVFTDARLLDEAEMQGLARELQLSETVFV